MARPKQSIIEYRSYDFPGSLPIQIHNRMNWRISSVKSSRLHIHNCFEIGLCLSGSGKMNFGEEEISFQGGDVLFVARNVPHTTWSEPDIGSVWKYIHIDPERLYPRILPSHASLDACEQFGIPHRNIIAMQGPFSSELNRAIIHQYRIRYLVSKDGGVPGGFPEKAEAARETGTELILLCRPEETGSDFETVYHRCITLLSGSDAIK